jgi:hypothetical protein
MPAREFTDVPHTYTEDSSTGEAKYTPDVVHATSEEGEGEGGSSDSDSGSDSDSSGSDSDSSGSDSGSSGDDGREEGCLERSSSSSGRGGLGVDSSTGAAEAGLCQQGSALVTPTNTGLKKIPAMTTFLKKRKISKIRVRHIPPP